jgi:hypothetical protein
LSSELPALQDLVASFRQRKDGEALTAMEAAMELATFFPDAQLRVAIVLTRVFGLHPMDATDLAAEVRYASRMQAKQNVMGVYQSLPMERIHFRSLGRRGQGRHGAGLRGRP